MNRAREAIADTHDLLSDLWSNEKRDGAWSDEDLDTFKFRFDAFHTGKQMEIALTRLTGTAFSVASYRPFLKRRHKRFIEEIADENRQLHLVWSGEPKEQISPCWFFAMAEGYAVCGFGVIRFRKEELAAYRTLVDTMGDNIMAAVTASGGTLSEYGVAPMKRVPKPYDIDHPHEALLRRKSLAVVCDVASALKQKNSKPQEVITDAFTRFLPLNTLLKENLLELNL